MRRIILLGAPGSGKSTQGQKLAEFLGCAWISTGELFRKSEDPRVKEQLKTEKLIDDETTFALLANELSGVQDAIIDGFPRTKRQAEMALSLDVSEVIEIDISDEEVYSRLALRGREQDTPEVIAKRLADYRAMRQEVDGVLVAAGVKIKKVDGLGTVDEVFNRVKEVL